MSWKRQQQQQQQQQHGIQSFRKIKKNVERKRKNTSSIQIEIKFTKCRKSSEWLVCVKQLGKWKNLKENKWKYFVKKKKLKRFAVLFMIILFY